MRCLAAVVRQPRSVRDIRAVLHRHRSGVPVILVVGREQALRGASLLCLGWRETPTDSEGRKVSAIETYEGAVGRLVGLSSIMPPAPDRLSSTGDIELCGSGTIIGLGTPCQSA